KHTLELAARFGFHVLGVDPVERHIELANKALEDVAIHQPKLHQLARFASGTAEMIPADDASVDLIWCRDVLVHVAALDWAYASCRRVLRAGGHMLVYQMFGTERLEPREAAWLWATM